MCGDNMQILSDIINFIKTLSFVDIIFFGAVLGLMMLIITLIYFIKENNEDDADVKTPIINKSTTPVIETSTNNEITNLKEITAALENAEPSAINLNNYEVEQEEKAIISYDELIKNKNNFAINFSEEENIAENLTVKKVDLENLVNKDKEAKPAINVTVISYDKEEAFLKALKSLQQTLN